MFMRNIYVQFKIFVGRRRICIFHDTALCGFSSQRPIIQNRADFVLVPSQWETLLQGNAVSHWLGANLESALRKHFNVMTSSCDNYIWLMHLFLWSLQLPASGSEEAKLSHYFPWLHSVTPVSVTLSGIKQSDVLSPRGVVCYMIG